MSQDSDGHETETSTSAAGKSLVQTPRGARRIKSSSHLRPELVPSFIDEPAVCLFLYNYALKDGSGSKSSYTSTPSFDYVPTVLAGEPAESPLYYAVCSLGKVGLANRGASPRAMAAAAADYAIALRLTNNGLQDAKQVISDSLLVAVMLLGVYESTSTVRQSQSLRTWVKHMNGVAALIGLRGPAQFRTRMGRRLFTQARSQAAMSCMHRRAAVPDSLAIRPPLGATLVNDEERAIHELAADIVRFCNCRAQRTLADISKRVDTRDPDPAAVVLEMFSIDSSLADWAVRCPPQLRWSTVSVQESSDTVFSDYYDIYDGLYCATLWNHYRSTLLHLLAMLKSRLSWFCEYSTDLADSVRQTCTEKMVYCTATSKQLALDVCASVAYNLGLEPRAKAVARLTLSLRLGRPRETF